MDAKEFLEIVVKECDKSNSCINCRFNCTKEYGCCVELANLKIDNLDKVIEIAEEIKRNRKTYKDDFLSKFPNAKRAAVTDIPIACRNCIYNIDSECNTCDDCWNEEYKGE